MINDDSIPMSRFVKEETDRCIGVIGRLFGHTFIEAANADISGLSAEQLGKLTELSDSNCAALLDFSRIADDSVSSTRIVKAIYCSRCGKDKQLGNGTASK